LSRSQTARPFLRVTGFLRLESVFLHSPAKAILRRRGGVDQLARHQCSVAYRHHGRNVCPSHDVPTNNELAAES
jgi:hypothetical protein